MLPRAPIPPYRKHRIPFLRAPRTLRNPRSWTVQQDEPPSNCSHASSNGYAGTPGVVRQSREGTRPAPSRLPLRSPCVLCRLPSLPPDTLSHWKLMGFIGKDQHFRPRESAVLLVFPRLFNTSLLQLCSGAHGPGVCAEGTLAQASAGALPREGSGAGAGLKRGHPLWSRGNAVGRGAWARPSDFGVGKVLRLKSSAVLHPCNVFRCHCLQ